MLKSIFSCEKLFPSVVKLRNADGSIITYIRGYYVKELIDMNTIPFGWHIFGFRPYTTDIIALDRVIREPIFEVVIDKVDVPYIIRDQNTWAFLTHWCNVPAALCCPKTFEVDKITISIANPVLEEKVCDMSTTMLSLLGFSDSNKEKRVTLDNLIEVTNRNDTIVYDVQSGKGYKLNDLSIKELMNYEVLDITDVGHPVYRMATEKKVIDVISKDLL